MFNYFPVFKITVWCVLVIDKDSVLYLSFLVLYCKRSIDLTHAEGIGKY
jgi:hypothetical protein